MLRAGREVRSILYGLNKRAGHMAAERSTCSSTRLNWSALQNRTNSSVYAPSFQVELALKSIRFVFRYRLNLHDDYKIWVSNKICFRLNLHIGCTNFICKIYVEVFNRFHIFSALTKLNASLYHMPTQKYGYLCLYHSKKFQNVAFYVPMQSLTAIKKNFRTR